MKQRTTFFAVLIFSVFLELFCFNFSYFYKLLDSETSYNVSFQMSDLQAINWQKTEKGFVSEYDPILQYGGLDMNVNEILVWMKADRGIPYAVFFYTDESYPEFGAETMIELDSPGGSSFVIPVNRYVRDMRLDLGDDAGLNVTELSVTVNPLKLDFSVARCIAVLVIYFGFWGLNQLQKTPEYIAKSKSGSIKMNGEKNDGE